MRIALLGGRGFIGAYICADLRAAGHEVLVVSRGGRARSADGTELALDETAQSDPAAWQPLLRGVDTIVNAAGVLRGRRLEAVHVTMPRALYQAAAEAGVRRVVLISAISARPDVDTDYARTKLAGEAVLRASRMAWTILRPSLVYAEGSYGGTSLLRGLAGLPWRVPLPGDGRYAFSPIHARDLARTVRIVSEEARFTGQVLEPAGPDILELATLLDRYRRWLGFRPARFVHVPMTMMRLLGRLGDVSGDGPLSTTSLRQMIAGNAGDGAAFADAIGFRPLALDTSLADRPAQVQDRWHARLYFLAPVIRIVLALMWVVSAVLGLACGAGRTTILAAALGFSAGLADALRIGGSLLDLAIATLVIADPAARRATPAQLVTVLGYTIVLGVALPGLWLDPLGPLLKNLPILALILVHGAIADRR